MKRTISILTLILVSVLSLKINVSAAEMSNEFKSILNKDGKMEIKSVEPTSMDDAMRVIFEYTLYELGNGNFELVYDSCNENFTKCDIQYKKTGEKHSIEFVYNYDKEIKEEVKEYVKKIEKKQFFSIQDMEVVNFWVHAKGDEIYLNNYSTEIKSIFNYKNFMIDARNGEHGDFIRSVSGFGNIILGDTIYYLGESKTFEAKHILYIPDDTGDSKEELIAAIQKRIDDYMGKDVVKVSFGGNVYDYQISYFDGEIKKITDKLLVETNNTQIEYLNKILDIFKKDKQQFIENWNGTPGTYSYLKEAEGEYYFNATIPSNEGSENVFKFILVKNSEKMFVPNHLTVDASTNIEISSNNSNVPLDAMIRVKKIVEGMEDYDKILKILELNDSLIFDLSLYSNSLNQNIAKLDSTTFEVKIPLSENFKGKELLAYHVDDNGKVEEYKVKVEGNYAMFNTNHFSVYALGYKDVKTESSIVNPNTLDPVLKSVFMSIISLFGVIVAVLYLKRKI